MELENIKLDWEVETQKLYNKEGKALSNYRLLTRSDNGALLNVCKRSYTPTSNQTFKETVDKMRMITGFELSGFVEAKGGRRIFAYLKSDLDHIAGHDINNYMVIGNSHDYSSGFFFGTTHYMIRCENQWANVRSGAFKSISHTAASGEKIDELVYSFQKYMNEIEYMKEAMEKWKNVTISQELREAMINRVLDVDMGKEESLSTRTINRIDSLQFSIDREMNDLGENLLGLFHGVTHYATHVLPQKERVFGNIIGKAELVNRNAYQLCAEEFAMSVLGGSNN